MSARRPYRRPMSGWWRGNPFYREYMLHESTAVPVAIYAFLLIAGLWALGGGRESWEAWVSCLRSPPMLGLHGLILAGFTYHLWSWFHILPRTIRPLAIAGKRIPDRIVVSAGLLAALAGNTTMFALLTYASR